MTYVRTNLYPVNHANHLLNEKYIKCIACTNVPVNKFTGVGRRSATGSKEESIVHRND